MVSRFEKSIHEASHVVAICFEKIYYYNGAKRALGDVQFQIPGECGIKSTFL